MEARWATTWLRRGSQSCYYLLELLSSLQSRGVTISRDTRRYIPLAREHIPCAYDPSIFHPGTLKTAHPSILFVAGTLAGRKRGTLLLEAFSKVRSRLPDAHLTIVSHDLVRAEGVTCVSGLSPEALGDLYRRHWVLCSTSSYEGFGVPYIEAMASGLPIVTTTNDGATEILENGRLGAISSANNLHTVLGGMLTDRAMRKQFADAGISAASLYSIDLVVKAYEAIYADICRTQRRSSL
ncbi:MAG: glycosyltransferase family 4 protein [Actinomycetota bacterium]|nr:glycosyltransferase family 4 protein [Actinomycetota bacterium]